MGFLLINLKGTIVRQVQTMVNAFKTNFPLVKSTKVIGKLHVVYLSHMLHLFSRKILHYSSDALSLPYLDLLIAVLKALIIPYTGNYFSLKAIAKPKIYLGNIS